MTEFFNFKKSNCFHQACVIMVVFCFMFNYVLPAPYAYAQSTLSAFPYALNLPQPGTMVSLTPAYTPTIIKGMTILPDKPLDIDFIIDIGDDRLQAEPLQEEVQKLVTYFMSSLTLPADQMWVNLSPYEKDRITTERFGQTEMGRDLLAQDYMLKQLASSLMYPDDELGYQFWEKVYQRARDLYGTTEIPFNTMNKVWIVPDKADIYVHDTNVFISNAHLKVMLEEDYLSLGHNQGHFRHGLGHVPQEAMDRMGGVSSDIIREVLVPAIEKEVNEGRTFANLRQIYNSMILAVWYKKNLKQSLLGKIYADQDKLDGLELKGKDAAAKQEIYDRYLTAVKQGVYDFIRDEYDPAEQDYIPRRYFSGGINPEEVDKKVNPVDEKPDLAGQEDRHVVARVGVEPVAKKGSKDAGKVTRRGILGMIGAAIAAPFLSTAKKLTAQIPGGLDTEINEVIRQYSSYFTIHGNWFTGLSHNYFGDDFFLHKDGTQTYDMALQAIARSGEMGYLITQTYARNVTLARGEDYPQTMDENFFPTGGVLHDIRISGFEEPNWWEGWQWHARSLDNAWIGIAAMHNYVKTHDPALLKFAMERAEFLLGLQAEDGAFRHEAKTDPHSNELPPISFWEIKTSRDNEIAIAFFDVMYKMTGISKYQTAADAAYDFLVDELYDPEENVFQKEWTFNWDTGEWGRSTMDFFVPGATFWAPLDRMLEDYRFGNTREERLEKYARMVERTEELMGVVVEGEPTLKGITYDFQTHTQSGEYVHDVISIELSAQYALSCQRLSEGYYNLGAAAAEAGDHDLGIQYSILQDSWNYKDVKMVNQMSTYFTEKDGAMVAPEAVYPGGRVAAGITNGDQLETSPAYAAMRNIYYGFAASYTDPLKVDTSEPAPLFPRFVSEVDSGQSQVAEDAWNTRIQPGTDTAGQTAANAGHELGGAQLAAAAILSSGDQNDGANSRDKNLGGIDLNPAALELNTGGDPRDLDINVAVEGIQDLPVEGFTPVIFGMTPVVSFPALLGT